MKKLATLARRGGPALIAVLAGCGVVGSTALAPPRGVVGSTALAPPRGVVGSTTLAPPRGVVGSTALAPPRGDHGAEDSTKVRFRRAVRTVPGAATTQPKPQRAEGKGRAPLYICRRTPHFEVDGDLSKPQWQKAQAVQLVENVTGGAPRYPTTVRLLYDDQCLYAAFHAVDKDIWGTMSKRDSPIYREEVVELFIDPASATFVYYEIEVSPRNVVLDLVMLNAGRSKGNRAYGLASWDNRGIRSAVKVEGDLESTDEPDRYWDAEIAIPFEPMVGAPNTPPEPGDEWRINLFRIERPRGAVGSTTLSPPRGEERELSAWSPTLRPNFHVPEVFGTIRFE